MRRGNAPHEHRRNPRPEGRGGCQGTAYFPTTLLVFLGALWVKAIYPASSGIADTDFYWHIAYGRWILEHSALPAGDIFSWTMSGAPYRLTQWLGETLMGVAYNLWGLNGTKLLSVALAAITIRFAWRAASFYVHTSIALGIALVCNLVQIVIPMRPQLFSFAMLAILACQIAAWSVTGRRRHLLVLPPLMTLWVNLHGGYVVGLIFIGIFCVGQLIETWQTRNFQERQKDLIFLCSIAILSGLATLINPYGLGAWESVFLVSGLHSASVISEWMPVNLTTEVGWFYLMNLVPFIALLVLGARTSLTYMTLAGVFLVFGVMANRQVAMCAAVMAPLTAALLARAPQYPKLVISAGNPNRPLAHSLVLAALLVTLPWITSVGDARREATINNQYPVRATTFLQENKLTERVMSDTLEASYLIYVGVPVFIDGRMDLYRDKFFFDWYLTSRAAPGWEHIIKDFVPRTLLLRNDMALRQVLLASGGWKPVFIDDRYTVLVPDTDEFVPLPAAPSLPITYLDKKGRLIRRYMP